MLSSLLDISILERTLLDILPLWVIFPLTGLIAGFMAGLFGIGGGFIIVPILLFVLPEIGIDKELATHFAIGTSLACIVITSISSTRSHHLRQSVNWQLLKPVAPGLIIGAILASKIASLVSGAVLMSVFVVGALVTALYLFFSKANKIKTESKSVRKADNLNYFIFGNFTGFISSLIGIGGGSILVPFYVFKGQGAHSAVGTAAACGFPVALFGAMGYLVIGWNVAQDIEYSSGFIYWPAFIGIIVFSIFGAPIGVKVAHTFEESTLKKIFALFLVFTGSQIIYTQWFS
ncbi:MAG: putative membrane protein YfcA [Polaribacter sp.]